MKQQQWLTTIHGSGGKYPTLATFLESSQMIRVFYHSVIHGLGFFICLKRS